MDPQDYPGNTITIGIATDTAILMNITILSLIFAPPIGTDHRGITRRSV